MKIGGKKIAGPNTELVVIPRGEGEPVVIRAQAILDYEPFEQLCPTPKPPTIMKRGGVKEQNPEDPRHIAAMNEWGKKRLSWIVITSIRLGTPELEWDQVDFGNPNTWSSYEKEFKESGLSEIEVGRILRACLIANCLDDDKLDEARSNFLLSQEALAAQLSFQKEEQSSMPSGEPASDSDSPLQM